MAHKKPKWSCDQTAHHTAQYRSVDLTVIETDDGAAYAVDGDGLEFESWEYGCRDAKDVSSAKSIAMTIVDDWLEKQIDPRD